MTMTLQDALLSLQARRSFRRLRRRPELGPELEPLSGTLSNPLGNRDALETESVMGGPRFDSMASDPRFDSEVEERSSSLDTPFGQTLQPDHPGASPSGTNPSGLQDPLFMLSGGTSMESLGLGLGEQAPPQNPGNQPLHAGLPGSSGTSGTSGPLGQPQGPQAASGGPQVPPELLQPLGPVQGQQMVPELGDAALIRKLLANRLGPQGGGGVDLTFLLGDIFEAFNLGALDKSGGLPSLFGTGLGITETQGRLGAQDNPGGDPL